MFGLSPAQMIILLVVILLVFGTKNYAMQDLILSQQ